MVVRRLLFFMIGADRGLSTLDEKLFSFWLPTMRLAWLAVNIFSAGGEPAIVAAVGLRRRSAETELECVEAREIDPARLSARLILADSVRSTPQFSVSEEELLPLSVGVTSLLATCTRFIAERFGRFPVSIERRGDISRSEEDRLVIVGGGGEPSDFLDRKPAWKRFVLGLSSRDGSGAVGTGEEPAESFQTSVAR